MVRENLSVDTSFDSFIYSENAIFSSLVTVLRNGEKEKQDNFSLLNQVSAVVSTFQDGLFDAYYFECNYFFVEIYLNCVSLMNL